MVILCSGHLFSEICNLRFASCVITRFIVLFLFTLGLIQLGENKEPTNCLTKKINNNNNNHNHYVPEGLGVFPVS